MKSSPSDVDDAVADMAKELAAQNADRLSSVYSRGQALLPGLGIATALIGTVGYGLLVKQDDFAKIPVATQVLMLAFYFCAVVYLVRSGVLVLGLQGKQTYNILGPDEIIPNAAVTTVAAYKRGIAIRRLRFVTANYKIINRLMEALSAAQNNLRNATLALAAGGIAPVLIWSITHLFGVLGRLIAFQHR